MPAAAKYDPLSATPYTPPELPQPQAPMPSPLPTQGPEINGAVKTSGAIATVADGILRGFMQGRSYAQARQVMKLKKQTDDLQNSYNQDAQRLLELTHAGYNDPSATPDQKKQYATAKSAVDGSWSALMSFYGQHVEQPKKKAKGIVGHAERGLMDMIHSQDPMEVSRGWYQIAQQMGPPVYGQVAMASTPEMQAQRQAGNLMGQANVVGAQNILDRQKAQQTYDQLKGLPEDKLTDTQRTQLSQAEAVLFPPKETGAKEMYKLTNGTYDWFYPGTQPEGASAVPHGATRQYEGPGGNRDWFVPGTQPADWKPIEAGNTGAPKIGTFGAYLETKYGQNPTAEQMAKARREWASLGHFDRSGSGGAGGTDKTYDKWYAYYKEHYPSLGAQEWDAMARRKVEGTSQISAGQIAADAITQPKQFDNDVLSLAIDNLKNDPQWKNAKNADGKPIDLDLALENLVGMGDYGYQYHTQGNYWSDPEHLGYGKPNPKGLYTGEVNQAQLEQLERDLQNNIRTVLSGSKVQGLSPQERRAVLARMAPHFGPAAGRGNPPASPQAHAAAAPAPASSQAPGGGQGSTEFHSVLSEYPGLAKNFNAGNTMVVFAGPERSRYGLQHNGELEFWSANEPGSKEFPSPDPGKNVLEIYSDKLKNDPAALKQAIFGDLMHGMSRDPHWERLRTEFMHSFTPQELRRQDQHKTWYDDVNRSRTKFGPTYDAYIRGWLAHDASARQGQAQSGDTMYSPKQLRVLREMGDYLKSGHASSKGTVKKSAFLKANPGATDADWKGIKPRLEAEGYTVADD